MLFVMSTRAKLFGTFKVGAVDTGCVCGNRIERGDIVVGITRGMRFMLPF